MNQIKKLAGQTLIYGVGTIVPRFLHYAVLTPFYTYFFRDRAEYGVITELYAWMVILLVILTYGMETGYFRFAREENDKGQVYGTALFSLLVSSTCFLLLVNIFTGPISSVLNYPDHPDYIRMFAAIVAMDAFCAIPFAKLRNDNRPILFSSLKIINVLLTIGTVIFFLKIAPVFYEKDPSGWIRLIYKPGYSVGYVFVANLISSAATLVMLIPLFIKLSIKIDVEIWRRMIQYSFPLLIGGLAGSMNDVIDKVILRRMIGGEEGLRLLGEYGAGYKIGVLMALFIQMFRFAAEPFFFEKAKSQDAKETYASVMKYFLVSALVIYLAINLYLPVLQYFIGPVYREAIIVVPVISMAYLLYGLFINLSVWYKINDMTRYGAYITLAGTVITLLVNISLIPLFGYLASAWAHIACYAVMVILSYCLGRIHYPVRYDLKGFMQYLLLALLITFVGIKIKYPNLVVNLLANSVLIVVFILYAQFKDRMLTLLLRKS